MMIDGTELRPRLRPVEAIPHPDGDEGMFLVRDPTGIAEQVLTLSGPALFILSLFDGTNTLGDVRRLVADRFGQLVQEKTLLDMVEKLRSGLLLEGEDFEAYMTGVLNDYRSSAVRASILGRELGDREDVERLLTRMIPSGVRDPVEGSVAGLVAPHLDYPRGWSCYGAAYSVLRGRSVPKRVCVLGTNHFGRSTSVVSTGKPFETPLGVTNVDTEFLSAVVDRCGYDLLEHELDHRREHSVELQLMCLQHVFGVGTFDLVPFLCHDPCGPTGTKPYDGHGVDLADFADALAAAVADDGEDTLLVAGADLSHVGCQFGDELQLDEAFLTSVEEGDLGALERLEASDPDGFVRILADSRNPTRICSAGCLYVVGRILRDAKPTRLGYHQAFDEKQQICVSCTAMTYSIVP